MPFFEQQVGLYISGMVSTVIDQNKPLQVNWSAK